MSLHGNIPEWYQKQKYHKKPIPYCYENVTSLFIDTPMVFSKNDTNPTPVILLLV